MIGSGDRILVTGGAGFIASHFIRSCLERGLELILSVDKRTYAATTATDEERRHRCVRGDIGDRALIGSILRGYRPMAVVNFAAETHVDRSILFPSDFLQSNVMGVFHLLEEVRDYWNDLPDPDKDRFRFLQVSTDEVYGSLAPDAPPCDENASFAPNSPYAATKAAADHLARVYFVTYGFPTTIARCCNNYGAYQYPEKLIPLMIMRAVAGDILPIYGDGSQIRDWLYVQDHCKALNRILEIGRAGEVYNISAHAEMTNLEVARKLCALLDEIHPRKAGIHAELIRNVADRPGHDRRYALSSAKIRRELGWQPEETFASGLEKTVRWYLDNIAWMQALTGRETFTDWVALNYHQRRVL